MALLLFTAGAGPAAAPQGGCPPIGSDSGNGLQGDVNCDGVVDAGDALTVLLFKAGLPLDLPDGCDGP